MQEWKPTSEMLKKEMGKIKLRMFFSEHTQARCSTFDNTLHLTCRLSCLSSKADVKKSGQKHLFSKHISYQEIAWKEQKLPIRKICQSALITSNPPPF